ncbi:MAG: glycosyltransferase family 2 protein [Bacteroidota bacterium]
MNPQVANNIDISVVIPFYMGTGVVERLFERIKTSMNQVGKSFEVLLVDDRSPDMGWGKIVELGKVHKELKGIRLSRNFGQHYAMAAGLDMAKGNWVVVMDCDLQDRPEEIAKMLEKAEEGYDVVLGKRVQRNDGFFKRLFSRFFYKVLFFLTGNKLDHTVANFGLYHRKVIDAICSSNEYIRFFPTQVNWVGFHQTSITINHGEREEGESSYTFTKLLKLALDIMLSNSDKPLRLAVQLGFFISMLSGFSSIVLLVQWFRGAITVTGYASTLLSIWFLSGLIISVLGITGLYIGKIFEQVKGRPNYIIDETINVNN